MPRTYEKYYWLNEDSRTFLSRGYLLPGETAEGRIHVIAEHAEKLSGVEGFADKFEDYMSRGWFSLASPVWSNYGTDKGLPVSCFGSYVPDTMEGILGTHSEVGMMSKFGGGTSGYFGHLRPRGASIGDNGASFGAVHFMELFDKLMTVVSQGSVRRGYFAAYYDIEGDDFDEFVGIGSDGHAIQNLTHGICVGDEFLNKVIEGDAEARRRWAKVIQTRSEVGYPYIFFRDTVNRGKPKVFEGQTLYSSNLCSEICLPQNENESFTCVLSSMNLLHYDEWKDTDAVETMIIFLNTVCDEFIFKIEAMKETKPEAYRMMSRALNFTKKYRALGLGVLGWHSYLQVNKIPFESQQALDLNEEIFRNIRSKTEVASTMYGMPKGEYGEKLNATLMAVAPTKSSSFILGSVSQGIEPIKSNYFVKDLAKVKEVYKNPYLTELLESKGKNTHEVWDSILLKDGSVQHLEFLTEEEKEIFKTFEEIDPQVVINQAADRQKYIDQSQSLNLMIPPSWTAKQINALYLDAWKQGVKTLYYQHSKSAAQNLQRDKLVETQQQQQQECSSCEA